MAFSSKFPQQIFFPIVCVSFKFIVILNQCHIEIKKDIKKHESSNKIIKKLNKQEK